MEAVLQKKIVQAAAYVENQLDTELEKLDNLDINDFEKLRENRLRELKNQQQKKQQWLTQGHGEYSEITDEKEFFEISKKSDNIVCLFYKDDSPRCKIVDHHFKILAPKHLEARFCKLNVERCPFLTQRLRIKIIPTVVLIVESQTKDYIVGFTDLGNCDDFTTATMESRIAISGAIFPNDDNMIEGCSKRAWMSHIAKPKTIKGKSNDDDDDDED